MAALVGVPKRVKRFRMAARTCNSVTWRSKSRHYALAEQFEAAHLGFDEAAPMIAGALLPYFSAQATRSMENGVPGLSAGALVLPWPGVLARQDNLLCGALGDGLVTSLRVIRTVATDACDDFVLDDLIEQAWQHRSVADGIVRYRSGKQICLQRAGKFVCKILLIEFY